MFESARRDLAWVPRWPIVRVNRRQSVAEHSYFTTCYGLELAAQIGWPECSLTEEVYARRYVTLHLLALYLLRHDEDESFESDIPGPVKRLAGYDGSKLSKIAEGIFGEKVKARPEISAGMLAIRKAADLIDECFYLAGEVNSGNQAVRSSLEHAKSRLVQKIDALPTADVLVKEQLVKELLGRILDEETQTKDTRIFANDVEHKL